MRECIICGRQMSDDATTCGTCGFSSRRRFLSRTHYQSWMEQTVIPYRKKWERQTESSVSSTETSPNSPEEKPVILRSSTSHPKNSNPKRKLYALIAAGVAVIILIIGILIGTGLGGKSIVSDNQIDTAMNFVTNVPRPSNESETRKWLKENGFASEGDNIFIGQWDAYYDSTGGWYLSLKTENPMEYYEELQSRLEKLGYQGDEYISADKDYYSTTFDIGNSQSIDVECSPSTFSVDIFLSDYSNYYQTPSS